MTTLAEKTATAQQAKEMLDAVRAELLTLPAEMQSKIHVVHKVLSLIVESAEETGWLALTLLAAEMAVVVTTREVNDHVGNV